jgi:hypothetical protein
VWEKCTEELIKAEISAPCPSQRYCSTFFKQNRGKLNHASMDAEEKCKVVRSLFYQSIRECPPKKLWFVRYALQIYTSYKFTKFKQIKWDPRISHEDEWLQLEYSSARSGWSQDPLVESFQKEFAAGPLKKQAQRLRLSQDQ